MYFLILVGIVIVSFCFSIIFISIQIRNYIKDKHEINKINQAENYLVLLDRVMDKSYQMVYKNDILPYSIDAYELGENQYNSTLRNYINLVWKFLGPNLRENLVDFFGDEQSLILNISEYFNTRYENDEIRKSSMDNMMEQENV